MPEPFTHLTQSEPSALLKDAIGLIETGDRARARLVLARVLNVEPQNGEAWRWLATCVDTLEQRCYCLGRQLALDPENAPLRRAYERIAHALQRKQASSTPGRPKPEPQPPISQVSIPEDRSAHEAPTQPMRLRATPTILARGQIAPSEPPIKDLRKAVLAPALPTRKSRPTSPEYIPAPINWPLWIGSVLVAITLLLAFLGPYLSPADPLQESYTAKLPQGYQRPPYPAFVIPQYPLGSDEFGRDILSRLLWSVRPTLLMVFFVASIRLSLGLLLGLISGWKVGWLRRALDTLIGWSLAIPVLFVALFVIAATSQNWGVWAFILGLSITGWAEVARVIREQTRLIKGRSYIESARALGASDAQILGLHILPQIMPLVWVLLSIEVGSILMVVAGLGFIGYFVNAIWLPLGDWTGIRASGLPELGQMVSMISEFQHQPWGVLSAGTLIFLTVLGFNFLGDGLNRVLSPEARQRRSVVNQVLDSTGTWLTNQFYISTSIWRKVSPTLVGVIGLAILLLGGGVWVIRTQAADKPVSTMLIPGGNQWAAVNRDAQSTYWTDQPGLRQPEVAWSFAIPDGSTGGPVVEADGTIDVVSTTGKVYAVAPSGSTLWVAALNQIPVQSPALGSSGRIYVVDQESGLSALDAKGKLLWHYAPPIPAPTTPLQVISAPIVGPDEVIYYANDQFVMAVDINGRQKWLIDIPTFSITNPQLRLTPDGKLLILDDTIMDAQTGAVRFSHTTDPMDGYLIGTNGKVYLRKPDSFMVSSFFQGGMSLTKAGSWDTRLLNSSFRFPHDAGVTPHGRMWLLYSSGYEYAQMIWLNSGGSMMSPVDYPYPAAVLVGFDRNDNVYMCGEVGSGSMQGVCRANAPGSNAAIWKLALNGGTPVGGALASGRMYVTFQEGFLYALADP